jgi:outer membrane protein assembly factor BamD
MLLACSTTQQKDVDDLSPNQILSRAQEAASDNDIENAITLFEKLEGRAAGTPLEQQALLEQAYLLYKDEQPAQAIAKLDTFIKIHPGSPTLDYALYLKGIINFQDEFGFLDFLSNQDFSERDQTASENAYIAFEELVSRFPNSKYANDARQRMDYIVNALAAYEVNIARYYYSRGAYLAAVNRAQIALVDYRNVPALEEALFILYKSYEALDLPQLRDDAQRVMQASYPESEYLKNGFQEGNKNGFLGLW